MLLKKKPFPFCKWPATLFQFYVFLLFMNVIELSVGIDVSCEHVFSGYKFDYYSFWSSIYWNGFCVIGFSIEQRLDFDG